MNNNQLTTLQVDWNLLFSSMILFVFLVGMIKMVSRDLLTEHHSNIGRQLKPATEATPDPKKAAAIARDYWDTHLEHNPLRVGPKDTDAGAFLSYMIENAGDILREMGKQYSDPGYMIEKVNRLRTYVSSRDYRDPLSPGERERLEEVKNLLAGLPTPSPETKAVKNLISSIAERDVEAIGVNLDKVESLVKSWPVYPATGHHGNPQTQLKTSTNLHEVITNLRPQFPTFKQAIDQSLEEGREIGYVIDDKYRLTGPFIGSAKGVRFPLTKEELENLGAIGTFHTHIEREIPVPSRLNWMWMGLRDDKVLCVGGKARERYYLYVGLRKDDLVEEKTISLEYTKVDNPGETILPSELVIPAREFREQVLADIQRSQPKYALEALSSYYNIPVPSFVTMAELYTISPCLYGAAEDTWGSGAEAMYMPQRLQRIACRIRTNEDFIVVNPEVDITEYPMHVIEEFYHHLFNHRPKLLKDYPHDEEFACMMVCRSWRVN